MTDAHHGDDNLCDPALPAYRCQQCEGEGWVEIDDDVNMNGDVRECPRCEGTGYEP